MRWPKPLVEGTLVRRYQRFLADVTLPSGETVTVHCPNSGSMMGCALPGSRVWISPAATPGRRCAWTWEMVLADGCSVAINTMLTNGIVRQGIIEGEIPELAGYDEVRPEVRRGESRIDLLLTGAAGRCWVEVKSVTLSVEGRAMFPDAKTERGRKHLRELHEAVVSGDRAVIFFLVQRGDCGSFSPADHIDPQYGALLREVSAHGVEVLAYRAEAAPEGIAISCRLPVEL